MTCGDAVSARERESQRAGARQAALLGRVAGPSASAGARERAARLGRTGGKEEKQPGSDFVFVFLFQIYE
jgi:hypothetical protein